MNENENPNWFDKIVCFSLTSSYVLGRERAFLAHGFVDLAPVCFTIGTPTNYLCRNMNHSYVEI